jgi:hypothetical protein
VKDAKEPALRGGPGHEHPTGKAPGLRLARARLLTGWGWLFLLAITISIGTAIRSGAQAQLACDICGKPITTRYYQFEDKAVGGTKVVCPDCERLENRCFLCGLPVLSNYVTLDDGRVMCRRDYDAAIHSQDDAKRICQETGNEMNRYFGRFMTYPGGNVSVSIVDRFTLEGLFKNSEAIDRCVSIYGATQTRRSDRGFVHSINILGDLPKARLSAVAAHEYTHTWINENVSRERREAMAQEAIEGLCEFMAYKLMEIRGETFEMEVIRKNDYTKGQIIAFIEAEKVYGLNEILDWMKNGQDSRLDIDHLERVRAQSPAFAAGPPGTSRESLLVVASAPEPKLKSLVLQGISGTSLRRFAIINDRTFEQMESGHVRLGETNVLIQCLEIRKDSVMIEESDTGHRQELFLRAQ